MNLKFTDNTTYTGYCPFCGKPYVYVGDVLGDIENLICMCHKNKARPLDSYTIYPYQYGWICSKCGRSNSPYVPVCQCYWEE